MPRPKTKEDLIIAAKENYEKELTETKKRRDEIQPAYKKAIDDEDLAKEMPNKPSDFYGEADWKFKTEQQKKDYLNSLSPEGKKYMENWVAAYENRVKLQTEYFELNALIADGIISKEKDGIVILATGKLDKKLSVKASRFTKKAAEAIVAAGGKIEVI